MLINEGTTWKVQGCSICGDYLIKYKELPLRRLLGSSWSDHALCVKQWSTMSLVLIIKKKC